MKANANKFPRQLLLGALLLVLLLAAAATATAICNIDSKELSVCRPAVAPPPGQPMQPPTEGCCSVVRSADLKCLCSHKSALPSRGINMDNALALLPKCGLQIPSECYGS